jgi:hypothetical protein
MPFPWVSDCGDVYVYTHTFTHAHGAGGIMKDFKKVAQFPGFRKYGICEIQIQIADMKLCICANVFFCVSLHVCVWETFLKI